MRKQTASWVVLGTAQFGMNYGATNTVGKVAPTEVEAILRAASAAGVELIDTATTYGDAQAVLGQALRASGTATDFEVVTKVHFTTSDDRRGQLRAQLERTLEELAGCTLYGVMVHHGEQIGAGDDAFIALLEDLRREYGIKRLGGSFYEPAALVAALRRLPLDVVQVPFNVLNQDFGVLAELAARPEIHVRSVFLQGILLAPPASRPAYFDAFATELQRYDQARESSGVDAIAYNLTHARSQRWIDRVVLGVTCVRELRDILAALSCEQQSVDGTALASRNRDLTNPSHWKL